MKTIVENILNQIAGVVGAAGKAATDPEIAKITAYNFLTRNYADPDAMTDEQTNLLVLAESLTSLLEAAFAQQDDVLKYLKDRELELVREINIIGTEINTESTDSIEDALVQIRELGKELERVRILIKAG